MTSSGEAIRRTPRVATIDHRWTAPLGQKLNDQRILKQCCCRFREMGSKTTLKAWYVKRLSTVLERRCTKSVGFYALFGVVGGVCGVEKEYAFWSASVNFHALFGLVGEVCGAEKGMHFGARVWISMPFLASLFDLSPPFLVSEGLRPMLGPCCATKIPNAKRKMLDIHVWAF